MTYTLCKKLIKAGNFTKDDMQMKLDVFLLNDRISDQEYNQLVIMMDIKTGDYVKEELLTKLDTFLLEGKITEAHYSELIAMVA